ncbi:phosphoenolpyruvate--protein phosphotransferase [Parendozoicomonas haliclonae]|uniref:phosphoenolpyruvate--protein phosphotransferase n=1 Tax=Parendozoicomonas haliclonae TaxID=1960125 RepID=A0A1X7AL04_9GAMM|nr:phosphoenolpyruvate--protein phosphotransferase [Parendozoicomonas haliclonae]SMA47782.1 Phosphoenolpyruvate-protein phosphotransferase [Parendozoicomonas haliclonae]
MSPNALASDRELVLLSPLSGLILPLTEVPDPAFAQRMMGDGIAIDPTSNRVVSPVDGTVSQLFRTHHALTLTTAHNKKILIHIGLDTVALKGEGFKPLVAEGDTVTAGQPLIEFDMDYLAQHARSLITPVLIDQPKGAQLSGLAQGFVEGGKTPLMRLADSGSTGAQPSAAVSGEPDAIAEVVIPNPTGLHARPSAVFVKERSGFTAEVRLSCNGIDGRSDSVTEIMKLNTRQGDVLTIKAWGDDAEAAVKALVTAVQSGLGEDVSSFKVDSAGVHTPIPEEQPLLSYGSNDPNRLSGVKAAPGRAVGKIVHAGDLEFHYQDHTADSQAEKALLEQSLTRVRNTLSQLVSSLQSEDKKEQSEIFAAHLVLLDDPAIASNVRARIDQGFSAGFAWDKTIEEEVGALRGLNNPILAGRAADIQDVGNRVLADLTGVSVTADAWPENAIPVYRDVTPSDLLTLDLSKVVGLCSLEGGASSHAAIISRSLDLPYLAGVDSQIHDLVNGTQVIINADKGYVQLNPTAEDIERCQNYKQKAEAEYQAALQIASEHAVTSDGTAIEVAANIGSLADAKKAVELGAEGVGLLRTEFLYLDRITAPTEDEQTEIYTDILQAMGPDRPVIIRTLDVGGDKPLAYLPLPAEENPFLGERGIRVGINRPSILRTQIRALLRSAKAGKLRVMLPMIGSLDEFRAVKKLMDDESANLNTSVELGIMIEVPSAALMAQELAREAAFFSIGTNDLTQYTLAMDRGHPRMASRIDGLHPAVLRMIAMTCKGAAAEQRWTGVCGGLASDLDAIPLLLGLGVNELSVSVPTLPLVKAKVRQLDITRCRKLASEALNREDGAQVRALLKQWQEQE